jgi:S-adenosylmethionine:tRNA ribosyltransferase-isomerase
MQPGRDLRTDDFDFALPDSLIAQQAVEPRDHARLLQVRPGQGCADRHVYDLPDLLQPGDVIVMNNTKVIPARLFGQRGEVKVELLLHKPEGEHWLAFAKPGKRLKICQTITIGPDFSAEILEKREGGEVLLRFACLGHEFMDLLQHYGQIPLPPYIKRPEGASSADISRYQTVYAQHEGSVAAPTAGLHFTPDLIQKLKSKGIEIHYLTLHVGAGTFLPVKVESLKDHVMHAEWGEISAATATALTAAKQAGRRIVAVGTTSMRLLETAARNDGSVVPFIGETSIFIYPGYHFKLVDLLMTNFHLPKSTLFMLVSAFSGLETMQAAYAHAIAQGYRFYSYGDSSLLEKA